MSQLLHGGDLFIAVGSEPFNIDEFVTGVNSKSTCMYFYVRVYILCMPVARIPVRKLLMW